MGIVASTNVGLIPSLHVTWSLSLCDGDGSLRDLDQGCIYQGNVQYMNGIRLGQRIAWQGTWTEIHVCPFVSICLHAQFAVLAKPK